jgi:hypothetical protein
MNNPFGNVPGLAPSMPAQSSPPPQQSQAASDGTKMIIGPVVLAYPNLFAPRKLTDKERVDGKTPKYDCEMWIYSSSPYAQVLMPKLAAAVQTACSDKWGNRIPNFRDQPIRNLGEKTNAPSESGWFIRPKSHQRPAVLIGQEMTPVTDSELIYSGCIVYAEVRASAYVHESGSNGVTWYLNWVLKVADGPRVVSEEASYKSLDVSQIRFDLRPAGGFTPPTGWGQQPVPQMPNWGQPSQAPNWGQQPPAQQAMPQMPQAPNWGQQPPAQQAMPQMPQMPGWGQQPLAQQAMPQMPPQPGTWNGVALPY